MALIYTSCDDQLSCTILLITEKQSEFFIKKLFWYSKKEFLYVFLIDHV